MKRFKLFLFVVVLALAGGTLFYLATVDVPAPSRVVEKEIPYDAGTAAAAPAAPQGAQGATQ